MKCAIALKSVLSNGPFHFLVTWSNSLENGCSLLTATAVALCFLFQIFPEVHDTSGQIETGFSQVSRYFLWFLSSSLHASHREWCHPGFGSLATIMTAEDWASGVAIVALTVDGSVNLEVLFLEVTSSCEKKAQIVVNTRRRSFPLLFNPHVYSF